MAKRPAIGILGGTFDPVHCGHLRLALEVRDALDLQIVHFVPLAIPHHRQPPRAELNLRLEMLRVATARPGLALDTREIERPSISYTFDTLASFRAEFPQHTLCFILGRDTFNGLPQWHRWQELTELAHLVVASRPEVESTHDATLERFIRARSCEDFSDLMATPAGRIFFLSIPLLPISATDIRARVCDGRSIDYLVPQEVQQIIERTGLYQ